MRRLLRAYRGTGADLPFADPTPSHPGVDMEGYFWRVTVPATGQVVIALIGVNQGPAPPPTPTGSAPEPGTPSSPPRAASRSNSARTGSS